MRHLIAAFLFAALFFFIGGNASAYSIRDDATGGDCFQIGTWDSATKTCTLTADIANLSDGISIDSDGITLDGNRHSIGGIAYQPFLKSKGIYLYGKKGVTIKNLRIHNFTHGIYLSHASYNALVNNIIFDSYDYAI